MTEQTPPSEPLPIASVAVADRLRRCEARLAQLEDWRAERDRRHLGWRLPLPELTAGQQRTLLWMAALLVLTIIDHQIARRDRD